MTKLPDANEIPWTPIAVDLEARPSPVGDRLYLRERKTKKPLLGLSTKQLQTLLSLLPSVERYSDDPVALNRAVGKLLAHISEYDEECPRDIWFDGWTGCEYKEDENYKEHCDKSPCACWRNWAFQEEVQR